MSLNLKHFIAAATFAVLFTTITPTAYAHDLKNNTARVELRDNHFRILLNVAILDWLTQVGPHIEGQQPTFDEAQIEVKLQQAKDALVQDTRLWGDQTQAKLKILHFPKAEDIRELLVQFAEVQKRRAKLPHGFGWWNIQLEGIFDAKPPHSVSVSFPESLGELSITFTQPSSRQMVPGGRANFQALRPTQDSDGNTQHLPWILVGILSLGLIGQRLSGASRSQEI